MGSIFTNAYAITIVFTVLLIIAVVMLHYEGLRLFSRYIAATAIRPRFRIAALIFGQLLLHLTEIWLFATAYYVLLQYPVFGSIQTDVSAEALNMIDFFYYSATVYSTLGFGDLIPYGPIRFLTGMESVTGLLLITWSASFTFLEMQKYWDR
jgi:hypothetical protein